MSAMDGGDAFIQFAKSYLQEVRHITNKNKDVAKTLFRYLMKRKARMDNAISSEELKCLKDDDYYSKLVNLKGDNDKLVFKLDTQHEPQFVRYMRANGDVQYIISDMQDPQMKLVTIDKGEIVKVQDFLRTHCDRHLEGNECYIWKAETIQEMKKLYTVYEHEVEQLEAHEQELTSERRNDVVTRSENPIDGTVKPIHQTEAEMVMSNSSAMNESFMEEPTEVKEISPDFTQRSEGNTILIKTQDNPSGRSDLQLPSKNERKKLDSQKQPTKPSIQKANQRGLAPKKTKTQVPARLLVSHKKAEKNIVRSNYREITKNERKFSRDDTFVIRVSEKQYDSLKEKMPDCTFYRGKSYRYISLKEKNIEKFCLSLSVDEVEKMNVDQIHSTLMVGEPMVFQRLVDIAKKKDPRFEIKPKGAVKEGSSKQLTGCANFKDFVSVAQAANKGLDTAEKIKTPVEINLNR